MRSGTGAATPATSAGGGRGAEPGDPGEPAHEREERAVVEGCGAALEGCGMALGAAAAAAVVVVLTVRREVRVTTGGASSSRAEVPTTIPRGSRARERAAEIRRAAGAAKRVDERGDVHGIEVRVRGGGETDGEDATRPLALQHVPEQARAIPLRVAHRGDGDPPGRGCRRDGGDESESPANADMASLFPSRAPDQARDARARQSRRLKLRAALTSQHHGSRLGRLRHEAPDSRTTK